MRYSKAPPRPGSRPSAAVSGEHRCAIFVWRFVWRFQVQGPRQTPLSPKSPRRCRACARPLYIHSLPGGSGGVLGGIAAPAPRASRPALEGGGRESAAPAPGERSRRPGGPVRPSGGKGPDGPGQEQTRGPWRGVWRRRGVPAGRGSPLSAGAGREKEALRKAKNAALARQSYQQQREAKEREAAAGRGGGQGAGLAPGRTACGAGAGEGRRGRAEAPTLRAQLQLPAAPAGPGTRAPRPGPALPARRGEVPEGAGGEVRGPAGSCGGAGAAAARAGAAGPAGPPGAPLAAARTSRGGEAGGPVHL